MQAIGSGTVRKGNATVSDGVVCAARCAAAFLVVVSRVAGGLVFLRLFPSGCRGGFLASVKPAPPCSLQYLLGTSVEVTTERGMVPPMNE